MKVAAVVVVLGALVLYLHHRSGGSNALPGYKTSRYEPSSPETEWAAGDGGQISARALERWLEKKQPGHMPYHGHPMRCWNDPSGGADYTCTDLVTGTAWAFNVDPSSVGGAQLVGNPGPSP